MGESIPRFFPLTVAAIDTGSNAIRFVAARFTAPQEFEVLEYERVPVRLGHQVFLSGRLAPETMSAALEAFRSFARRIEEHGVAHYRAVATSAVREAENGHQLVDRIRDETGIELETISGSEEARLVHLAVASRIDLRGGKWVLADLGGGSVEVSLVDDVGILWSESHTMGSVRLLEELSNTDADPGHFQRLLSEYTSVLRIPAPAQYWEPNGFIATGGNIEALADLAAAPEDADGVATLPVVDLERCIELLARLSYRDRMEQLDLRHDRADVILPAAMVYLRLAVLSRADRVLVPDVGVKEGLLLDLVDEVVAHDSYESKQEEQLAKAATSLGRRFMFDEAHGLQVSRMALRLFEELQELHGLGDRDRMILIAAAILHDVGEFIAFKKHHKHSLYIISRSELPGLSPREMLMAGNVARYHRRSLPAERHHLYMKLAQDERRRVDRMAALVRVADCLDRQHVQAVERIVLERSEDSLVVALHGDDDFLLERWALAEKKNLFEKVFDIGISAVVAADHAAGDD